MYTTIEPRLIALLNTDISSDLYPTTAISSLELPPLHDPNILKASGRPLLLEPDASERTRKPSSDSQLASQLASQHPVVTPSFNENEGKIQKEKKCSLDRTLGNSSPQSLRKILDSDSGYRVIGASKKRNIVETGKDDFVQLPQPPKKQKATKQVVPPIIIGLFEPPPQAALFPPIASSSFHDSHGRNTLNTAPLKLQEKARSREGTSTTQVEEEIPVSRGAQKKDVKTRKKWTEEETNSLLLGVSRHGVGSWMDILEDPSFSFNGRSRVDLKDRFRTCCPVALCKKRAKREGNIPQMGKAASKTLSSPSKSSLMTENVLTITNQEDDTDIPAEATLRPKSSKTRTHRKKLEDLTQLGIERPFLPSYRRERKPFSEQDDHEIMLGYDNYGPAWTRIQRDTRFHLQNRLPTDLRDRFRNKHPEKFASGGVKGAKDGTQKLDARREDHSNSRQSPVSVQLSSSREGLRIQHIISTELEIEKAAPKGISSQVPIFNFAAFPEQLVEPADGLPFTQSFDWGSGGLTVPFPGIIGEMDISRLLLDDSSWIDSTAKERSSFTDINSSITSNAEALPQLPNFMNMLVVDEQMVHPSSDTTLS